MAKNIEFGLLLHTRHLIRDGQAADFSSVWRQAQRAEEMGWDHIWLGDSVTVLQRARGDCLTLMAALAMATRTVRIGTVPLLMSLRHPVTLAHALATIDVISNGRLLVAASAGPVAPYMAKQFQACGVPAKEKAGRLGETIEIVRTLFERERLSHDGRYFKLDDVGILPKPLQQPLPILLATGGAPPEATLRRAAKLGDGAVTTAETPEIFAGWNAKLDSLARAYGRELGPKMLFASFRIDADGARAREEGWAWMEDFFRRPRADLQGTFTPVFGTPDECAALLRRYAAGGMTGVIARIASEDTDRQAELLVKTLKPALQSAA
jgi:alkanesulfonate monooxygenase SsuD/methylene tetrahydromethanopterin reductase-like flavin-dependent oxidoreductase (luciferase family)